MPKYNKKSVKELEVKPLVSEPVKEVKLEEEVNKNEPKEEVVKIEVKEKTPIKQSVPEVKYREVVYLGISNEAERIGAVTGNVYIFNKDSYRMPVATQVDERDYLGLISEKGKGCARRDASILFMSKLEWDLEIEQARIANSA